MFLFLSAPVWLSQGSGPEDFSHLPPEQRRKKLQGKLDELNKDIQKEMDQRYLFLKVFTLVSEGFHNNAIFVLTLVICNKDSKDCTDLSNVLSQGRSNQDERRVREEPSDGRPDQRRPPAIRNRPEH